MFCVRHRVLWAALLFSGLAVATSSRAADHTWTGIVDNDFFNPGNWDTGGVPVNSNDLAVIDGGMNQPVVIGQDAGEIALGGFQLGTSGENGGQVIQNGGTLIIAGTFVDNAPTGFEFKSHIGDQGTLPSSWIMNNDATILYDGPLDGDGIGLGTDGINSYDLEIGARVGMDTGEGRLELHDNALLRISDDLKIGAEDAGNGIVVADGNSRIAVGSGISLGENSAGVGRLHLSQSALVISGNSSDPGDTVDGRTNEGYLTLSVDDTGSAELLIADEARLYARTLQQRAGESIVGLSGSAELHIFDVFQFPAPELGQATVKGSVNGNERTSHLSSGPGSETSIFIQDNATMSVDSDIPDSEWSGLVLSGGTNRGGNSSGGTTLVAISDSGTFSIAQDLHMTMGTEPDASSTLQVEGPNATIQIAGDLRMALDMGDGVNPGTATIRSLLTASSHSTIQVGGEVNIDNARLSVDFLDYEPAGGESYTLISAGSVSGGVFAEFDLPPLPDDLAWDFATTNNEVILTILGGTLPGDYNEDGALNVPDIDLLNQNITTGDNNPAFDFNGDGVVDIGDQADWLDQAATSNGFAEPYLAGDTNLDGIVNAADLNELGISWLGMVSTWSGGDLNADGLVNASDLNLLALNWQQSIPAATPAVPEPGTFVLVIATCVGLGLFRRRSLA